MLQVQGMFMLCLSKDLGLVGKPCQEIGAKIGRATHISMAKDSPSESQPAMARQLPGTMLCLQIGNLDKLLREGNSSKAKLMSLEICFKLKKICSYIYVCVAGYAEVAAQGTEAFKC